MMRLNPKGTEIIKECETAIVCHDVIGSQVLKDCANISNFSQDEVIPVSIEPWILDGFIPVWRKLYEQHQQDPKSSIYDAFPEFLKQFKVPLEGGEGERMAQVILAANCIDCNPLTMLAMRAVIEWIGNKNPDEFRRDLESQIKIQKTNSSGKNTTERARPSNKKTKIDNEK